jgi:enoyl-CoA hydratase/carnithine racemase
MPAFGGTWRLARRVGFTKALEMMFTGAVIDAATAKSLGLVLDVADGSVIDEAKALAARIGATSAASVAAIKKAVLYGYNRDPRDIDAYEQKHFAALFGPEQSQRMHAFLEQQAKQ